jgi:hypothetical protein
MSAYQPQIRTQAAQRRASEFPARSFFLYGEPKVGKTTTAASFPRPLILNVRSENGAAEITGDLVDIETPGELSDITAWLTSDPQKVNRGYRTVVLDGISTLAVDVMVRTANRDTRRAAKEATAILRPALHEFLSLPCIRIITGHARRDEEEIDVNGRKIIKISVYPDLPPRLRLFVEGRVDAIGYCYPAGGKSSVWWLPLDTETPKPRAIAAGNRLGLPRSTDLTYEAIAACLVASNAA